MNHDKLSVKAVEYWLIDQHGRKQLNYNTLASARADLAHFRITQDFCAEIRVEVELNNEAVAIYFEEGS